MRGPITSLRILYITRERPPMDFEAFFALMERDGESDMLCRGLR